MGVFGILPIIHKVFQNENKGMLDRNTRARFNFLTESLTGEAGRLW